jgi:hypothetical protein
VLVNHVGDEVASFGLVDHLPALSFLDGTGQPMTQLTATSLEIRSYDPAYGRAKLGVDGLSITGKQRQGVQETPAVLISTESGPSLRMAGDTPSMELTNLQQRIVLRSGGGGVPITAWRGAGSPSIELSDHRTKSKVVLGRMLSTSGASGDVQQIEDTGIGAISLLDDAGTPRLQLLGGSYPTLAVLDDAGHFRALFGRTLPFDSYSSEPPYTATVRGAAGAMEWQAPPPGQPAQK